MHDHGGIPQVFILPPTPQQCGFSRSEEAGEDGDGEFAVCLQFMRVKSNGICLHWIEIGHSGIFVS